LGAAGVKISRDSRWSSWRIGLECIWIWHVLVLVAAFSNRSEFQNGLLNWYTLSVLIVMIGMTGLYILMVSRKRARPMAGEAPV
jgi:hypothetical protein